jgi:hypothetical protein
MHYNLLDIIIGLDLGGIDDETNLLGLMYSSAYLWHINAILRTL